MSHSFACLECSAVIFHTLFFLLSLPLIERATGWARMKRRKFCLSHNRLSPLVDGLFTDSVAAINKMALDWRFLWLVGGPKTESPHNYFWRERAPLLNHAKFSLSHKSTGFLLFFWRCQLSGIRASLCVERKTTLSTSLLGRQFHTLSCS